MFDKVILGGFEWLKIRVQYIYQIDTIMLRSQDWKREKFLNNWGAYEVGGSSEEEGEAVADVAANEISRGLWEWREQVWEVLAADVAM